MIDAATLEQRLVLLEAEVTALKQQAKVNPTSGSWLDNLVGSIADEEGFEQVLEYRRAFRHHDRLSDDGIS
jgi:hypothetical protein